jgi:hypothetical protein
MKHPSAIDQFGLSHVARTEIRQSRVKALFEMMDSVDFVDGMDTEKTHLLSL